VAAPYVPEDFDDFWQEAVAEAYAAPLDYRRSLVNAYDWPGFEVKSLTFRSVGGRALHGWIAYPPGARRLPSFLWIPPYGRESKLPDAYGTRQGFASLSFNFHGEGPFHQERYVKERGYFAEGAGEPDTWIFRRMLQDCIVATRVLQAQTEADEDRIGAMGMSQGGGLAIWLAAWCPIIKAACADMPFFGDLREVLSRQVYRYPLKELVDFMEDAPLGRMRVHNSIAYFDSINQATRCRRPALVSLGLRDPASRPANVRAIYDALAGEKRLVEYDWGHDWYPAMVDNNRQWLLDHF